MKPLFHTLLIALFILFTSESKAQNYIPFPDNNAMWTNTSSTLEWAGEPLNTPLLLTVDYFCMGTEDTVINAVNYNKVNICGSNYYGAMRDNGGQVYFIPENTTTELLIYDFTKSVGDTIFDTYFQGVSGGTWSSENLIVEQIDSTLIGSEYHKKFSFVNMGATWIEGIGNSYGLFRVPYSSLSMTILELKCMSSSNVTLYPIYGSGTCPMNVSVNEIDFTEAIQISPNPTTASISISVDGKLFSYELYDITGKSLLVSNEETTAASIHLETHQSGVYLLRVRVGDDVKTVRVVKE